MAFYVCPFSSFVRNTTTKPCEDLIALRARAAAWRPQAQGCRPEGSQLAPSHIERLVL